MIKRIARRAVGERVLGIIDYYRYPERRQGWGGPFNGQEFRLALFHCLIERLSPGAIVETGTHFGTTTECLAASGRPVFTIEGDLRLYGFATARLRKRQNVVLVHGDSRTALRRLFDGPLHALACGTLFFYLDAHWKADLPLAEELEIVFGGCKGAVAMVDDFQVPGDSAYGYDDYGPGRALALDYIAPAIGKHGLAAFYPSTPGAQESGARRGFVVLARNAVQGDTLSSIPLLRGG